MYLCRYYNRTNHAGLIVHCFSVLLKLHVGIRQLLATIMLRNCTYCYEKCIRIVQKVFHRNLLANHQFNVVCHVFSCLSHSVHSRLFIVFILYSDVLQAIFSIQIIMRVFKSHVCVQFLLHRVKSTSCTEFVIYKYVFLPLFSNMDYCIK